MATTTFWLSQRGALPLLSPVSSGHEALDTLILASFQGDDGGKYGLRWKLMTGCGLDFLKARLSGFCGLGGQSGNDLLQV